MPAAVQVRGIREVSSALRKVDKEHPRALRLELLEVARDVVSGARSKVPHMTGKARDSVRPRATARSAAIAFGGNAAPYFPWLDFGGTTGKGHRPGVSYSGSVKRDWLGRPFGEGRYIYPTIEEKGADIEKGAEEAVVKVARSAGLGVK